MVRLIAASLLGLLVASTGCHRHVKLVRPPLDADAAPSTMKKFSTLVAKAKERPGFFDTYQRGDDLFIAVPKQRLGEPFLLHCRIAQGIGADPLATGQSLGRRELSVVAFERHGDRLFLMQRPMRTLAKPGSALHHAVAQAFGSSVLQSAAIESERPDGAAVANLKGWVLGDLSDAGELVAAISHPATSSARSLSPNKDRSYVESVKSFPDNLNVRASLTFTPAEMPSLPNLPDSRFVSMRILYTFARLPAQTMAPRFDDDRIGFLATAQQDFGSSTPDFVVHYANRWRLDPVPTDDGAVRPRQPIVIYIDPSVPEAYRPLVKEGIEAWQPAFAAAGWSQAIVGLPLPKGADPDDLRYPTIRWDVSQSGHRGVTSLMVDPRSGEILGASIRLSQNMISTFQRGQLPLIGGRVAMPHEADGLDDSEFELGMGAQGAVLRTSLIATGVISPIEPTPQRMLIQGIKKTVMHEVGHALGLAHNFKASSGVPNERLADPAWVRQHGLTVSVMDYPGLNLPKGPVPAEWYYYTPVLGPSDHLAITWGYTRDEAQAEKLARTAAQAGHVLGLFDAAPFPSQVDPTDQTWDLGSDPLTWTRDRSVTIKELWQQLPQRMLVDNTQYGELTEAFLTLLSEYMIGARVAVRYIGGQYSSRDHVGDPDGKAPFSAVPKARQREAVDFLLNGPFAEATFTFAPALLSNLGTPLPNGLIQHRHLSDVRLVEQIEGYQETLLGLIFEAETFARLRSGEMKYGPAAVLTLPELFDALSQGLWSELYGSTARNVGMLRRDLQRRYLERLGALLLMHSERGRSTDLHALARYQLSDLKRRLAVFEKAPASVDAYTRAHIAESLARITKLLDVQIVE